MQTKRVAGKMSESALSDYERQRLKNIQENNKMLEFLGLSTSDKRFCKKASTKKVVPLRPKPYAVPVKTRVTTVETRAKARAKARELAAARAKENLLARKCKKSRRTPAGCLDSNADPTPSPKKPEAAAPEKPGDKTAAPVKAPTDVAAEESELKSISLQPPEAKPVIDVTVVAQERCELKLKSQPSCAGDHLPQTRPSARNVLHDLCNSNVPKPNQKYENQTQHAVNTCSNMYQHAGPNMCGHVDETWGSNTAASMVSAVEHGRAEICQLLPRQPCIEHARVDIVPRCLPHPPAHPAQCGVRVFQCAHCGRCFPANDRLQTHLQMHIIWLPM